MSKYLHVYFAVCCSKSLSKHGGMCHVNLSMQSETATDLASTGSDNCEIRNLNSGADRDIQESHANSQIAQSRQVLKFMMQKEKNESCPAVLEQHCWHAVFFFPQETRHAARQWQRTVTKSVAWSGYTTTVSESKCRHDRLAPEQPARK